MDPTTSEQLSTLTAPMEMQMSVKEENYRTAKSLSGIVMKVQTQINTRTNRNSKYKMCRFSLVNLCFCLNSVRQADRALQCMVFVESPSPGSWRDSPCETKGVTPKDDGSAAVHCECTEPGYVAVFLVKDDSGQLILMPQKPLFSRRLEYKLVRKHGFIPGTPATLNLHSKHRMALDFEKAVGEDETARERFCDIQKDQVSGAGSK